LSINILKLWAKKNWVKWFTDKPYKIAPFHKIFACPIGISLDVAESASAILLKEEGKAINYSKSPVSLNTDIIYRTIDNKKRYLPNGLFKEPDRYVYSIAGGVILGPSGLIYEPAKRAFVAESAKEWLIDLKYSPYTNLINYPEKIKLPGLTLSCLTNSADSGFYHFLFESIVKIHLYQPFIDACDTILFNGPPLQWKLNWLNRAGINISKIVWVDNRAHYACGQLLFTNRLINDQQINHWCLNALKKLFNVTPLTTIIKKPVWISRKGLSARDIAWEDEILKQFPQLERVDLSQLGAIDTISVMQSASHVISPHGAGLSNIYLCAPGTKVMEIYPDGQSFQPCYQRIATLEQLEHAVVYLDFKNADNDKSGLAAFSNILSSFIC
jgi:capsular polysaccharide biosynthesis protein